MSSWTGESIVIPVLFGSVFGANVLTMSVMNFTEAGTSMAPAIYLTAITIVAVWMIACRIGLPAFSRREHILCCVVGTILFLREGTCVLSQ